MNKKIIFLVLTLMVLTSFSTINFTAQPASASPPLTGDVANATATVSTSYNLMQSGSSNTAATTFSDSGNYKIYVHVGDADANTANSSAVNQSVTPSAPLSPGNQNLIHPFTTGGLTVSLSSSQNPTDEASSFPTSHPIYFNATAAGGTGTYYYSFSINGTLQVNSTSDSFSHAFTYAGSYTITVSVWASGDGYVGAKSLTETVDTTLVGVITSSQNPADVGQSFTLTVTITGGTGSPYSIQWTNLNGNIPGATSSTYTTSESSTGSWGFRTNIEDSIGGGATAGWTETVDPALTVSIASSENPADAGQSVTFTATGSGGSGSGYSYDFYVDGTSVQSGTSATYATTSLAVGSDSVYVTLTDSNSYTVQSSTITETIYADPTVSISSNDNPSIVNNAVTFTASVTYSGTISTYDFYLNGVSQQSGSSSTFTYTFTSTGTDTVYVVVTDSLSGQATSSTLTQTVNSPALIASLGSNLDPSDVGETITFTASATGGTGSYSTYDFFLNGVSEQSGASMTWSYAFSSAGSYSVYVNITDSGGHEANSNTVTQVVNNLPTVSFAPSVNPTDIQQTITFTATASGGSGTYNSYAWYLQGSLEQNTSSTTWSYDFTTAGSFNVYVIVYDSTMGKGTSGSIIETVNALPTVTVSSTINPAAISQAFTFSSTITGGTSPYTYQWYGPSGLISGATSPTYSTSESSAGTYQFYVIVTDSIGNQATSPTYTETVVAMSVSLTQSRTSSDSNQEVYFNATQSGGSGTISYAFYLDGVLEVNSTSATWSYTFPSSGTYNVTVDAYGSSGGHASTSVNHVVYTDPTVTISSSANPSDLFYDVTFTSTPAGGSGSYSYSWGGGTVSGSSRNLTWQFSSVGNFTVTLTLTDSAGYQVSASLTQRVNALPVVTLTSSSNPSVAGNKVYFNCSVEYGTGPFTYQFYMSIANANLAAETYQYTISNTAGSYYNSSYIYFNYSQPLSGISFPSLNFKIAVSNLTRAGLGGQVDTFTVINQNFTSYSLTQGTKYSLTGWKNVTSQSISVRFQTSEYVIPAISFVYSPSEYSFVSASTTISSTATVSGGIVLTSMVLLINGVESASQAGSGTSSISMTYSLSSWFSTHSVSPIAVTWRASSAQGTDHVTVDYQTNTLPPPHSVSVLPSNTSTHTFPITLTGVPSGPSGPSGTGTQYPIQITTQSPNSSLTYQQMLNINISGKGVDSNFANQLFTFANGTKAYTWIESYNTTSHIETVWVKLYSDVNQTINWQVYPSGWNFLNANGYLGESPLLSSTYNASNNAYKVFPLFQQFGGLAALPSYLSWGQGIGTVAFYPTGMAIIPNQTVGGWYTVHETLPASGQGLSFGIYGNTYTSGSINAGLGYAVGFDDVVLNLETGLGMSFLGPSPNLLVTNSTAKTSPTSYVVPDTNNSYFYLSTPTTMTAYYGGTHTSYLNSPYTNSYLVFGPSNNGGTQPSSPFYISYLFGITDLSNALMPTTSIGAGSSFTANGYYQQLITINNPSQYGINTIGSNIQFVASNGTKEYAWIQSVNSTVMQVWVKNFNASATIDMQVFPEFENLFSASGYLGEAPQLSTTYGQFDNGASVFPFYENFANNRLQGFGTNFPSALSFNDGLKILDINGDLTVFSNISTPYNNTVLWNGEFNTGTASSSFSQGTTAGTLYLGFMFNGNDWNGNGFDWYNNTLHPQLILFGSNGSTGSDSNYLTNTFQNYMVQDNITISGTTYMTSYLNNIQQQQQYRTGYVSEGQFGFFTQQTSVSYEVWHYVAEFNNTFSTMPTTSIGAGNVFMANASPSQVSSETGTPVGYGGNATYQLYSYTIPVAPSSDYLTVIYNSTSYFDPRSVTPGTYYVYPQLHAVTFFNLSGYTSVSLSLDEISPEIGQPVSLVVQPEQGNSSVIIDNSHLVVYYSLFGFKSVLQTSSYGLNVILPYGSTASFFLYNKWNQLVGSASNVSIDSLSPIINLPVNTATLSFDFLNASQESISLTSNGITVSGFFGSAQVAVGYSYVWLTSVYDSFTGRNVNYTGSVVITQSQQILMVSTNASASSFTVYVDSYGPSQQGQLGAPGEPLVDLTIDGHVQTPGQTYIAFVGSTYQVRVTDVLGQFLYESNVTVRTTTLNFYANITIPSWQWSIQNEEQVPSSSPLAIEQVSVKDSAGHTYNFTNDINQQSVLYLKQGNYTISAKDNATFVTNISLTQNENYVIFSQNLLTYAEFVTLMGSVLNNTQGLTIQTVSSESLVMPNQLLSFEFEVFYANSTQLDHSALSSLTLLAQITNSSGVSNVPHSFVISGRYVFLNFSAPSAGQYTASINAFKGSIGGHVSYFFTVEPIITQSRGMNMTGAGPSGSIDVNVTYNFTLLVYYSNGSLMNHKDTVSVFNNLTFEIFNGVDPAQSIQKLNAYNGEITFEALFNRTGTYSIVASSTADLNGKDYAHAIIPVSVINPTAIYAVTLTGSKSILVDVTMSYVALITSTEATNISAQEMSGFTNDSTLHVMTGGHVVATLNASTHINSTIYFAVNLTTPGNYTFVYQTAYRGTVLTSILFVRVFSSQPTSHNLIGTLTGPMDVERNATAVYTLDMLIESNGQTVVPTEQQTVWLIANTTYQVALNGAIIATGHAAYFAPGAITITLSFGNLSAAYSVIVTVGNTTLVGSHIWFRGSVSPISVLPYNPSNPPNPLVQLATGVGAQIFYLVVAIVGVIVEIYRRITKKERALKDAEDSAGVGIEGMVVLKYLNNLSDPSQPALTPIEQQMLNAIEPRVKDALVVQLTSGTVKLKEVKPQSRWRKIF